MTALTIFKELGFEDMEKRARALHLSGFYGFKDANQYLALMLKAQAQGRHPDLVVDDYHFFSGKASPKADAVLTWHLASGGDVEWIKNSPEEVEAIFTGPERGNGLKRVTATVKWTIEDARKAGLTSKDNWKNYPEDQLTARVIGRGVKRTNPGCLRGERLLEERMDAPEPVEAALESPASPTIPRASEMAAQEPVEAVEAEHTPVTDAVEAPMPEAPAATPAQPATPAPRAAKATAPAAPPQPPTGAIRLKETPTEVRQKEGADGAKTRYGMFFSVGVVGTFSEAAAAKAKKAVLDKKPIDVAFTTKMVSGVNKDGQPIQIEQRDLVWIEGALVEA